MFSLIPSDLQSFFKKSLVLSFMALLLSVPFDRDVTDLHALLSSL